MKIPCQKSRSRALSRIAKADPNYGLSKPNTEIAFFNAFCSSLKELRNAERLVEHYFVIEFLLKFSNKSMLP